MAPAVASLGHLDENPAFCDCLLLDVSAVLAAISPESFARLQEPTDAPMSRINLSVYAVDASDDDLCDLCRFLATLLQKTEATKPFRQVEEPFRQVEVLVYSSEREEIRGTKGARLEYHPPFPVIQFKVPSLPNRGYVPTNGTLPGRSFVLLGPETREGYLEAGVRPWLDWPAIRLAVSVCRDRHDGCGENDSTRNIPGFHVIDCTDNRLVPFSDSVARSGGYATLSYVWGVATDTAPAISSGSLLPAYVPLVVADAISVCLKLGIQYLWVDRYCILQQDEASKHAQIRNMNLIYKQSELTIIAAAGSGPDHGLPGVSRRRPDVPQPSMLKLGPRTIFPLPGDIQSRDLHMQRMEWFEKSTWNSRGWTYQEAVVSRRRLIFTDRLVAFQCLATKWDERFSHAFPTSPDMLPTWEMDLCVPQFLPHGLIGSSSGDFGHHASEYFGRHFTYISDQLVAFQGILQEFALPPAALRYLCAVPVYRFSSACSTPDGRTRPRSSSKLSKKVKALLDGRARLERSHRAATGTTALEGFVPGLCWDLVPKIVGVEVAPQRDKAACFPSWSWMGWRPQCRDYSVRFPLDRGHLELSASDFPDDYDLLVKEIRVGFGTTEEETSVPNDTESDLDSALGLTRLDALYLRITAWVFEAKITEGPIVYKSLDAYDRAPYHAALRRTDRAPTDRYVLVSPRDIREGFKSATFVVMFSVEDGSLTVCLALQPCGKHGNGTCFQRMGLLYLRRQESVDEKTWDRHAPSKWKPRDRKNTLFADSLPSEVCRMTSVHVC